jgi:hypothetical protein
MQTACWQLCFPIVLRELGTRHASPPRFDPVESVTPPLRSADEIGTALGPDNSILPPPIRRMPRARPGPYNGRMPNRRRLLCAFGLPALLFLATAAHGADMTKLAVVVKSQSGKPIDRASVIVRFVEGRSIVKLGKSIRTTFEMRTNQEGEVKIPEIPQGKIRIQIIAKGYQTYGQIHEIEEPEKTLEIKLNPPQQQYSSHQ